MEPQDIQQSVPVKIKRQSNKKMIIIVSILIVLILALGGVAAYLYTHRVVTPQDQAKAAEKEVANIMAAVGKLIVLPENETPTVATATDPEILRNQPFFAHVEVGDKVLIYSEARKAILYSPILNKIKEVSPVNPNALQQPRDTTQSQVLPQANQTQQQSIPSAQTNTPVKKP